jgi:hypothetical protein
VLLTFTILVGSGRMGGAAIPESDLWSEKFFCFYKMDYRPTADVTSLSCGEACECNSE